MDRRKEQADLILKIGMVFGPMVRVIENLDDVESDEQKRVLARFQSDMGGLQSDASKFTHGEPGYSYQEEAASIHGHTHFLSHAISVSAFTDAGFLDHLQDAQRSILKSITSIPISENQEVFAAQSPFSAHCYLRNLCATVSEELHWQDRYFDHTVFDRYLSIVPEGVQITLVTWPESKCKGKKDEALFGDNHPSSLASTGIPGRLWAPRKEGVARLEFPQPSRCDVPRVFPCPHTPFICRPSQTSSTS